MASLNHQIRTRKKNRRPLWLDGPKTATRPSTSLAPAHVVLGDNMPVYFGASASPLPTFPAAQLNFDFTPHPNSQGRHQEAVEENETGDLLGLENQESAMPVQQPQVWGNILAPTSMLPQLAPAELIDGIRSFNLGVPDLQIRGIFPAEKTVRERKMHRLPRRQNTNLRQAGGARTAVVPARLALDVTSPITVNSNALGAEDAQVVAQAQTPYPVVEVSLQSQEELATAEEDPSPGGESTQGVLQQNTEDGGRNETNRASNDSALANGEDWKFWMWQDVNSKASSDECLDAGEPDEGGESDDEFYDARSHIGDDLPVLEEEMVVAVAQSKPKVVLSKELWGLILEELYFIEFEPGSTFNVPSSFPQYRLVSHTFYYHITTLAYRHLELHNRQSTGWNANRLLADVRMQKAIMGEETRSLFRYTREVTVREIDSGYPAPELLLAFQNLEYINWICLWRPRPTLDFMAFPSALGTVFRQMPRLRLAISNFTLPLSSSDLAAVFEPLPKENLGSFELFIRDHQNTDDIRDFLIAAKNLKVLKIKALESSYFGFQFDTPGKLPPITELHLENYRWLSLGNSIVWDFTKLERLTMDDVFLVEFFRVVEHGNMSFPKLRKLVLRDTSTPHNEVAKLLSGLHTLVSSAPNLKELDVWYRGKLSSDGSKGESSGALEPITRLHVLRGVDGISNILEAILAAGN